MQFIIPYVDIHTHSGSQEDGVEKLVSIFLEELESSAVPEVPFSSAVHPWHVDRIRVDDAERILRHLLTSNPFFKAIGETGLDRVARSDYSMQLDHFDMHLRVSSENDVPVIIHMVRGWNDLLVRLKRHHGPFVIHDYHGHPQLTAQLLEFGACFSLGKVLFRDQFKCLELIQSIPADRLFLETDNSGKSIREVYGIYSAISKCPIDELKNQIFDNYQRLFTAV